MEEEDGVEEEEGVECDDRDTEQSGVETVAASCSASARVVSSML